MYSTRSFALPALAAATLVLAGCSTTASGDAADGGSDASVQVLASFYPLQYVTERVGGDLVDVSSLTPPGAEPHDVELSPRQVRSVGETDLVVYLSGFQAAVDEAVAAREPAHVVDAADSVTLVESHDTADHGAEDGGAEEHAADDDAHGALDPHFWLDPSLLADLAAPVAAALTGADPAHADSYTANAAALEADLDALDAEYESGLATCETRVVVTAHQAFGYLTARYSLEQVGISGLDPDAEPSPARLKEIGDVVRAEGVTTIFSEELLNPKVAQTLASDLGIESAVLDPVESLADASSDYRGVMEQNLVTLRGALGCS
ncbi:metal ABC transporter solute-binding protein, Zn/Mn family [Pengzhenrongella sicca]|uniref:Zinc ABC transporter substrate-binding protein n=1 Tax=Pengzhenrongella sicca TaxID=2819238 RepID=A0A8A4ZAL7_9MICO|nr:zinc ABC transporter substrate-binding protein [Pengzhenrongella sicca]QTE28465.1 zinc ABC transporter substrate-binding protein [Pengzhenrongella sicca]